MKRLLMRLLPVIVALFCVLVVGACAPKQATENGTGTSTANESTAASGAETQASLPDWTADSDCAPCHTTEAQSASDTAAAYSVHASQSGIICTTCHTDTDGKLADAHQDYATAKEPTKLKKTEVPAGVCLNCHNQDDLKAKTAGVTVLTDSSGTKVNPHGLPDVEDHEGVTCSSCHTGHKPMDAKQACIKCHHADVFECGTCHE